MSGTFTVACIQPSSRRDVAENLATIGPLIARARADGADLICLPEVVGMIEPNRKLRFEKAEPEETNRGLAGFREIAAKSGAWLLVGSLAIKLAPDRKSTRLNSSHIQKSRMPSSA